ncbi:MAG: hypothetical protein QOI21_2664 [Actinomycetota bacterium]|nr:hypothetical protein [Actinomycetota bacterium]
MTAEYSYEPFGATTVTGDDAGNPTRFTGQHDDGSGQYYYRARYYSTSDQRFTSQDPLGFASGDTDLYAYVGGDPTNLVDPLGTKPQVAPDRTGQRSGSGAPWPRLPDDGQPYLYRGVRHGHDQPDAYENAQKGIAVPRGGHSDPGLHNAIDTHSIFTSWTFDYEGIALSYSE